MIKKGIKKHTLVITLKDHIESMLEGTQFRLWGIEDNYEDYRIADDTGMYFTVPLLDNTLTLNEFLKYSWDEGIGFCIRNNEYGETDPDNWKDSSTKDYMKLYMIISKYVKDNTPINQTRNVRQRMVINGFLDT